MEPPVDELRDLAAGDVVDAEVHGRRACETLCSRSIQRTARVGIGPSHMPTIVTGCPGSPVEAMSWGLRNALYR
jgi:hypothetical protein